MSSENRSSSAVRNLRSLFENKATSTLDSPSPDSRGRSPSGVGGSDKENGHRPRSKVRASFIPVELAGGMATGAVDGQSGTGTGPSARRGSFSEADGDGALSDLKRTVSEQQKSRLVPEGAVESAAHTPLKKPGEGRLGHDVPPENPDKPVTGNQDSSAMKPADPVSEDAVSGGDALPPVSEDLRSAKAAGKKADTKKPTTNGKPAAISTKAPPKASSSAVKSPASQPKTPTSTKVSASSNTAPTASPSLKAPLKKPSRSSLTAPTAASLARSGASTDTSSTSKTSPTSKPKPREVTKPANVSSHLLAPTAASRAKHEPEAPPVPTAPKTTAVPSRPKAAAPAKAAPRASLGSARPASRDSTSTSRKSVNPADSSFLDRMMKPTAASAAHRHAEKTETKPAPKSSSSKPAAPAAAKPKVNGASSKSVPEAAPAAPAAVSQPVAEEVAEPEEPVETTPALETSPAAMTAATQGIEEEPTAPEATKHNAPAAQGVETPNGEADAKIDLEATPAALGGEETIRGPGMLWGILQN